ncbi:hypothetical protein Sros01_82440 [Streptomyces roseochromogenus]|nr:hypothetical protein Sros01_82440 [Streptomyces roseochromogenus]
MADGIEVGPVEGGEGVPHVPREPPAAAGRIGRRPPTPTRDGGPDRAPSPIGCEGSTPLPAERQGVSTSCIACARRPTGPGVAAGHRTDCGAAPGGRRDQELCLMVCRIQSAYAGALV